LPDLSLSFDLADLRGYHYHNGVVFAAYHRAFSSAMALGGRYDGVGQAFGRARPATGFSLDLRELARAVDGGEHAPMAILAPYAGENDALTGAIADLRRRGEVVVELLPGETGCEGPACGRRLVEDQGRWFIQAINRNGS
jgi:ATP phosphoribosyltransferase regulatory subunit